MTGPTGLEDRLIRHRAWVVMGVLVAALVVVGLSGLGRNGTGGGGASADRPRVTFGATVKEGPDASILDYTNGWVAAAGATSIAVYAGSEQAHHGNGLLVLWRSVQGRQTLRQLVLRGTGPVTLLEPPHDQTEAQALRATLHFVTANGQTGSLALANEQVSLTT